jgi:hypothetical protein
MFHVKHSFRPHPMAASSDLSSSSPSGPNHPADRLPAPPVCAVFRPPSGKARTGRLRRQHCARTPGREAEKYAHLPQWLWGPSTDALRRSRRWAIRTQPNVVAMFHVKHRPAQHCPTDPATSPTAPQRPAIGHLSPQTSRHPWAIYRQLTRHRVTPEQTQMFHVKHPSKGKSTTRV